MTQVIPEDLVVDGTCQAGKAGTDGVYVPVNNVCAVKQRSPFDNVENIAYFDDIDTLSMGPTQENAHRIHQIWNGPMNFVKRHIFEDFNANLGSALPPELSLSPIGHAPSVAYVAPSHLKLTTAATAIADGGAIEMNNITLDTLAETQLHFCLRMLQGRNIDLQFGLRGVSGGTDALRFRFAASSGADGVLVCTGQKGASASTISTSWADITQRRLFCIRIRKDGTAIFCAADCNNVLQQIASFPPGSSYIPSGTLVPFVQLRTQDAAGAVSLMLDGIYLITEW